MITNKFGNEAMMHVLDQNNKYGIRDSGLLVENDDLENPQWSCADSALPCYSTAGVENPTFIENTCSYTTAP